MARWPSLRAMCSQHHNYYEDGYDYDLKTDHGHGYDLQNGHWYDFCNKLITSVTFVVTLAVNVCSVLLHQWACIFNVAITMTMTMTFKMTTTMIMTFKMTTTVIFNNNEIIYVTVAVIVADECALHSFALTAPILSMSQLLWWLWLWPLEWFLSWLWASQWPLPRLFMTKWSSLRVLHSQCLNQYDYHYDL